jgi:hypothetical protein
MDRFKITFEAQIGRTKPPISKFAQSFTDLGLDDVAEVFRRAEADVARITAQGQVVPVSEKDVRDAVAWKIARGEITVAEGADQVAQVVRGDAHAYVRQVMQRAIDVRLHLLQAEVRPLAGKIIARLQAVIDDSTPCLLDGAARAHGITADAQTVTAPLAVREGWTEATSALARIHDVQSLAGLLRGSGLFATVQHYETDELWRWTMPSRVPRSDLRSAPVLRMVDAITAGAGPRVATAEQVVDGLTNGERVTLDDDEDELLEAS